MSPRQDTNSASLIGQLILLGGPPGAGKSTVAKTLATNAERPTVHLHTDSFYVWILSGYIPPYLPEAEQQNEVVKTVMITSACAYAKGGYDVIIEGILGPWLLPSFRAASRKHELGLSYVVLRPSLEVALSRATEREGRQLRDIDPIVGLYGAFADIGKLEGCVVDSSAQSVAQTVTEIAAGLRDSRFTLGA